VIYGDAGTKRRSQGDPHPVIVMERPHNLRRCIEQLEAVDWPGWRTTRPPRAHIRYGKLTGALPFPRGVPKVSPYSLQATPKRGRPLPAAGGNPETSRRVASLKRHKGNLWKRPRDEGSATVSVLNQAAMGSRRMYAAGLGHQIAFILHR